MLIHQKTGTVLPHVHRISKYEALTDCSLGTFWWDWTVHSGNIESREHFGEHVLGQIPGTSLFPGNSQGIPREYATKSTT